MRHDDAKHPYDRVRLVRDLVEITAIVIAGFWGFYVFAYENRIKPSFTDPQLVFSVTMTQVAERNGLIGIQINNETKNVGQVRAHLLGYAVWVTGRKVSPLSRPPGIVSTFNKLGLRSGFYRETHGVPVYGFGYVTSLGDPSTTADLLLEPGDDDKYQDVFFVPRDRFDVLEAYLLVRYTKYDDKVTPTRLGSGTDGLPVFYGSRAGNSDYDNEISRIVLK
ncbi:MAG: hypothetical protein JO302_02035 [Candidatus Eremiobacteraeota bacterium]|nr:hypothetical protein [Candidatus Eremiobacteraeota bacterium]